MDSPNRLLPTVPIARFSRRVAALLPSLLVRQKADRLRITTRCRPDERCTAPSTDGHVTTSTRQTRRPLLALSVVVEDEFDDLATPCSRRRTAGPTLISLTNKLRQLQLVTAGTNLASLHKSQQIWILSTAPKCDNRGLTARLH